MTVYLVGAGPGDPDLITVKGRALIAIADVILYDRLSSSDLLAHAPATCLLIPVGKEPGRHEKTQDEINDLLVAYGRTHAVVVRLKGGDPFVFGRGGEEAERLAEAGIPFEVVPGITSAIAGPAYAGIPVTHRGHNTSVTILTGHRWNASRIRDTYGALSARLSSSWAPHPFPRYHLTLLPWGTIQRHRWRPYGMPRFPTRKYGGARFPRLPMARLRPPRSLWSVPL
jgi:uroporphyrin-III C-methyltransferase